MKTKLYIGLIVSTLFLLGACGDLLNPEPVDSILADNFWQTAEHAEAGISAIYDGVAFDNMMRNLISFTVIASDEARNVPGTSGARQRMEDHQYTAQRQGNTRDLWRNTYLRMQWANDALENIPQISDSRLDVNNKRENLLGEAHFVRAYQYFYLTRLYGRVPLVLDVTKTVEEEAVNVTRNSLPEVFDQIISDLEQAIDLLPEEQETEQFTRIRATKGAARALLAKVYLWRGHKDFGGGNADFEEAASLAEQVISSSLYSLVDGVNYADIFTVNGQLTSESIWEISFENDEVNGNALHNEFQPGPIGRVRNVPTQKLLDAFDARPGDLRRAITIKEVDVPEDNNNELFYTGKHEQVGLDDPNVVVLRLADIILVRAEALNELGRTTEAIDLLNQIRTRAGLAPVTVSSQDEVRNAILEERLVELAFEGKRWYDLKRHDIAVQEVESLSEENGNTHQVLWPVPQDDRDRNPNLDQNPGYQ
ncbi:RagB/SusD family nutrient uptake outer membrane protein [Tunicatimonas pelagia]|uniref:RagB/SusD family nutrient uptake outer membrane protein n=1 Tax=Tunicatimonas pelagia TaxID=931531 RepID=UPI0026667A3B|nr:RagB/SusD family nutrient uptake outer membrane protein [Tunicatimonas pelagia]WKN44994.1 RagB/SusD family nutrient uptake outer membrane protein [Tunicatimonas pelagia]